MADIKNYLKEKEKREHKLEIYKQEKPKEVPKNEIKDKKKHKKIIIFRIFLLFVALGIIGILIMEQYKRQIYTGYDIVSSTSLETPQSSANIRLNNSILTYSKDGAHCKNIKGEVNWNQTYQLQDVKLDICNDIVAIGGYNERTIYIQNEKEPIGTVTTNMPIRDFAVSEKGTITAILADTDVTWINTYDVNGELCYEGQAYMHDSGYPVAVSLSPNGELLMVSYIYVDAGTLKTNIAFYNFGSVGSNYSDNIVSGYPYTDLIVPEVQFMDNETAFAVGDGQLMFYKGSQKPVLEAVHFINREIQSVFYSEKYVGVVLVSDQAESRYQIEIYNSNAKKVSSCYFSVDYSDIFFENNNIVIYNETECVITTVQGVEKFSGSFSKPVKLVVPVNGRYKYALVTDNSIDIIQLK